MYLPQQPSAWPKVIGIIAIIYGAAGILLACVSVASTLLLDVMKDAIADRMPAGQGSPFDAMEALQEWKAAIVVGQLLGMGLAMLILFVGIGLLKHRRRSVRAGFYWAAAKIPFELAYNIFIYAVQKPYVDKVLDQVNQVDKIAQQTPGAPTIGSGFFSGLFEHAFLAGVVLNTLIYSAFAVFWLIWFSRAKIKAEVAGWS